MRALQAVVPAPVTGAATDSILQVGAIGGVLVLALIALGVLYRQITTNAKLDRERAEHAEAREREARTDMVDKVMPALANVQAVLTAAIEAMRDERRDRR